MDYNYINNLNKHIPLPTVITSNDGMINSINIHTLNMFGYSENEIFNTSISSLFEGFDKVKSDISLNNPVIERELYVYTRKNKLRFTISAYPIYFRNNQDFDIIFIFEDIKK